MGILTDAFTQMAADMRAETARLDANSKKSRLQRGYEGRLASRTEVDETDPYYQQYLAAKAQGLID